MSTTLTHPNDNAPATADTAQRERFLRPYYEVHQDKDAYHVAVYVPGVDRKEAKITVEDKSLTVEARRSNIAPEGSRPLYRELPNLTGYRLRLSLNVVIDEDKIGAKTENGVLRITLPVADEAKPRRIDVN